MKILTKIRGTVAPSFQLVLPLNLEGLVPDNDSVRLLSHELEDLDYSLLPGLLCQRDINFMRLLAGQKAPDHSTIARLRTGFLADAYEDPFYQMVRRLDQMGELSKYNCSV